MKKILLILIFATQSTVLLAQPFIALDLGKSSFNKIRALDNNINIDHSSDAHKGVIGFSFEEPKFIFSTLEFHIINFGKTVISGNKGASYQVNDKEFQLDSTNKEFIRKTLGIEGSFELSKVDNSTFYGKVGAHRWYFKEDDQSYQDSGISYGIGFKSDISELLTFRTEFNVYRFGEVDNSVNTGDITLFSIGIIYNL